MLCFCLFLSTDFTDFTEGWARVGLTTDLRGFLRIFQPQILLILLIFATHLGWDGGMGLVLS